MMCDLGFAVKPMLSFDKRATEHILHKQGIGKLKHIDVAYLWVQDEIRSWRRRVRRVKSEENVADLGTKPLSKTVIAKHIRIRSIDSTHREIALDCSDRLQKVQSGRAHVSSSTEASSQSAPNASIAWNPRQAFTQHHEVMR